MLERHISYPVLSFYRSQHSNQSWLGALTVILDAASIVITGIDDMESEQARRTPPPQPAIRRAGGVLKGQAGARTRQRWRRSARPRARDVALAGQVELHRAAIGRESGQSHREFLAVVT